MGAYSISAVRGAAAGLPTPWGDFQVVAYRDIASGKEHAALVQGDVAAAPAEDPVLVRLHSECLTGDLFGSLRCDCGAQLQDSLRRVAAAGRGVILYLRQEGRGIGLIDKIAAYELQEQGLDTVEANLRLGHPEDARTYDAARDILRDLGVGPIRLLTNNPAKVDAMRSLGFDIVERVQLETSPHARNADYLRTKKERMGHLLEQV